LCRMAIILKANKVNLFVSSVLFVFWYHSPNVLDTPRILATCRFQWPIGLKRTSTAACLLRSWVLIPPGGMDGCLLCVLSGRGLCDDLISRSEESYRLWRVVVCDYETSWYEEATARDGLQSHRRPQPVMGCSARENK
jgi:hypothetical protein